MKVPAATLALVALACCGQGARAAAIPMGPAPPIVPRFCARVAPRVAVLCPARWPHRPRSHVEDGRDLTRPGFPGYLGTFNDPGFRTADLGHVILGGERRAFSLLGRPGAIWPLRGQPKPDPDSGFVGRIHVVRHATVGSDPALLVRPRRYPAGGIHGGHVVVLWNHGGHGYFVSLHFAGYPLTERIAAALAVARSSRPLR
jgi:hypothetical protein